ncbi:GGDEF domain-containing protein [Niveibacterium sp. SC-1]|uniref:GGDEF domain-containing protein n=1 Tax=Niveibacterium sp. SC-1 TaxID=3135646 RepID=UPI00311F1665
MGISNSLRLLLASLILATVALLGWQSFGPPRVLSLSPDKYVFSIGDDATSGGDSIAELHPLKSGIRLGCNIQHGYQWPYCTAGIRLGTAPEGVDLTRYDNLRLQARYWGPGKPRLRLFLRDFEKDISSTADWNSLKVNEVWFDIPPGGGVEIPLNVVRVASWWLGDRQIPLEKTGPRLDNVVMLEFSTANEIPDGQHHIDLQRIELVGRPFRPERLTGTLLACWFVFGIASLALEAYRYRGRYLSARRDLSQLQALNQTLQIETRELADKARSDPLTGALNRQGLRDFLVERLRGSEPQSQAMCVVFVDIDHFKRVNDDHGHGIGDEVLRQFAEQLRERLRSTDRLVRWGGEEFLIVCPETDQAQGCALAEKLRKALMACDWPLQLKLTASFGVAAASGQEDFGELITRADARLYAAKHAGRNRVVGHEPEREAAEV